MSKYLGLLLIVMLLWSGCSDTGVNPEVADHHFVLEGNTPIPGQNSESWWVDVLEKQKSEKEEFPQLSKDRLNELYKVLDKYSKKRKSPYAAFLSKLKTKKDDKNNKNKKFKYRYFKLHPPQKAIEEAEGEKTFYFHIFIDPSTNEIYQILAVFVPDTPEQLQAVKEWGDKLNSNSKTLKTTAAFSKAKSSCSYEDGLTWVPECNDGFGCFAPGTVEVCDDSGSGGGGGEDTGDGGGGDDPSDCYYDPGGCEEDSDPYGGGSGPGSSTSCSIGQVEDTDGNCVMGEIPCEGNPLKNPRIAAQTNSGIEGGRFNIGDNAVRDGGNSPHRGIDLKVGHGEAIFSMSDGVVLRKAYDEDGWGQFVVVKYPNIDGKEVWTVYAHLNNISIDEGETISPGTVLGTAGISGNLASAIRKGYATQHVHIETRIGGWSGKEPKNPEEYLTTQFDNYGNPVSGTDC